MISFISILSHSHILQTHTFLQNDQRRMVSVITELLFFHSSFLFYLLAPTPCPNLTKLLIPIYIHKKTDNFNLHSINTFKPKIQNDSHTTHQKSKLQNSRISPAGSGQRTSDFPEVLQVHVFSSRLCCRILPLDLPFILSHQIDFWILQVSLVLALYFGFFSKYIDVLVHTFHLDSWILRFQVLWC